MIAVLLVFLSKTLWRAIPALSAVLVDTILLEQCHDHAGDTEGALQPQEKPIEELTPAVPSGREQRTYALESGSE